MMKYFIAWVLVFLRLYTSFAPGEVNHVPDEANTVTNHLSVVQDNLYLFEGDDSGYFFAKVQNTGSAPIGIGSGSLAVIAESGDIILSQDYVITTQGSIVLEPGDYAYVSEYLWDSALMDNPISGHTFLMETQETAQKFEKVPCEAAFDLPGADSYDNYIYVTFTNTSDEPRYDFNITVALLDANSNLLLVKNENPTSIAIHPDSTITVRMYVDSDMMEYYEAKGLEPVSVDAIVSYPVE